MKIIVKISSNLINPDNEYKIDMVSKICGEVASLIEKGHQIIIVSSGAVMHGVRSLGFDRKPDTVPLLQSCAAIGQITLMKRYWDALALHRLIPAQILVSTEDFSSRKRYLNLRNTINTLLSQNVIPVFNENDTINTEELKFGDNDKLSSVVTMMMDFDMLVILTDVDGVYDSNPKNNPNAKLIPKITKADMPQIEAGDEVSKFSSGGMKTKLTSALDSTKGGIDVFIGNGFLTRLDRIVDGTERGTYILHDESDKTSARMKWLGFSPISNAEIVVDNGAMIALTKKQSSLLASGITEVIGDFAHGDLVSITSGGKKIAQGLTNFSSADLDKIKGMKSSDFSKYIDNCDYEVVIHKNNLYLLD